MFALTWPCTQRRRGAPPTCGTPPASISSTAGSMPRTMKAWVSRGSPSVASPGEEESRGGAGKQRHAGNCVFSGQDQRSPPSSGCSMTACRSLTPTINLSLTLPHSPPRIATAAQGAQPLAAKLLRQAPVAVCRHLGRRLQALPGVPVPRPAPGAPWGDGTRSGTWL